MATRDVTLAYDDDAKGTKHYRNVTLAYDDNTIGDLGFRYVTSAYDGYFSLKSYDGGLLY